MVCKTTGEVWLCDVDEKCHYKIKESFDSIMSSHEPGTATMKVGACNASIAMKCCVMVRPRVGCQRIYWSLTSVYDCLRLQLYDKVPSRWIYNSKKAWNIEFQAL